MNELDETSGNLSDVSAMRPQDSAVAIYENQSEAKFTKHLPATSKQIANARLPSHDPMVQQAESQQRVMFRTPGQSLPRFQAQPEVVEEGGSQVTDIYSVVQKSHRQNDRDEDDTVIVDNDLYSM